MPPRSSRQSKAQATAPAEREEGAYDIPNFDYHDPLSWRAGRAIPVADLFTRLQKLSNKLRETEQGTIDVKDIAKLAQDLVHPNLLGHKDKGIRAWTVSCVVDILNICAPNAPYRPAQLRDIFTVIINTILPALADPSNAYNAQHQYILDQLVDAQSIVLITDIQDNEQLLGQLFAVCFDIVSGSGNNAAGVELGRSVVFQLGAMLNTVVDEASLPQDVIDIIISQFLRVDPKSTQQAPSKKKNEAKDKSQSTLLLKNYPPAYNLAKTICTTCSEKMSAAISQYFSSIITNASAALTDDDGKAKPFKRNPSPDSDTDDDGHESLSDLRKAHRLVRELWRACPDVLNNVIPQLEIELAADSVSLRQLAVETLGDLVAGIGLVGLPDLPVLDPATFPLPTIEHDNTLIFSTNPLLTPASTKPFIHVHNTTYRAFMGRRIDKATLVRMAWAGAASRILLTRAGGIGLNNEEQAALVSAYAKILKDVDEKVRHVALQNLETFPYSYVIEVLGSDGGLSQPASLMSAIAERITDRKLHVRERAMLLLGSMWGLASGDIANSVDQAVTVLGQAPTKLLSAMYVKDNHVSTMLSRVLYECLLPLNYPPSKTKSSSGEPDGSNDPDALRVRRMLTLVRDLDDKAKPVFFGLQKRQADLGKAITAFLKACEEYNGGVSDDSTEGKRLEEQLNRFIESLCRQMPDPPKASSDLWKFAKAHDRRNYQLIRFAMGAEHDYKTMNKAVKELNKRLREGGASTSSTLDTLTPIVYQCALIAYNRSHIPAIMQYTRSTEAGFPEIAQEVLREISEKVPEVMKTHIQVLCKELEDASPTDSKPEATSAADSLKACAAFAKRFPEEIPQHRKFIAALIDFIHYSTSLKAAKHASAVVLTASNKKELHAKEILSKAIKRFDAGAKNKLSQLAAISQVCLYAPRAAEAEDGSILRVAMTETLQKNLSPQSGWESAAWDDAIDEETAAKQIAMKILVNRCRSGSDKESFKVLAESVLKVLMQIIEQEGEIVEDTPSIQRNHLRLAAGRSLVKLCRYRQQFEDLVTAQMFNKVTYMIIHRPHGVRKALISAVKKYLSTNKLNVRWTIPLFLVAFEPDHDLRISTITWLKSRTAFYTRQQKQVRGNAAGDKKPPMHNVVEILLARLLSTLVDYPDYPKTDDKDYNGELLEVAKFIIVYLQACATEENLSLIFHIAQRTKQASDAVSGAEEADERLYLLSDLAQATIRNYADQMPSSAKGVNLLQTYPGKAQLPAQLYKPINGHLRAQEIVSKNYLPEDVAVGLESLVRKTVRSNKAGAKPEKVKAPKPSGDKKRKSSMSIEVEDDDGDETRKSVKRSKKRPSTKLAIRETPNVKKRRSEAVMSVEQPSRKSARTSTTTKKVNYEESDDDEDEGEDEEDIVKYKPAPIDKYKHRTTKTQTPEIEEEEENQDPSDEDQEEAGSPTPHRKDVAEADDQEEEEHSVEPQDTDMTNGDDKDDEANETIEVDVAMSDPHGGIEEPEPEPEAEITATRNKRVSRGKATTNKISSPTTKAKSTPRARARKSKAATPEEEEAAEEVEVREVQEESEPEPEPVPSPPANKRTSRGRTAISKKSTQSRKDKKGLKAAQENNELSEEHDSTVEAEPETVEEQSQPVPSPPANKRTTRTRAADDAKSTSGSKATQKATDESKGKDKVASTAKTAKAKATPTEAAPVSPPVAEATRRTTKRTKT